MGQAAHVAAFAGKQLRFPVANERQFLFEQEVGNQVAADGRGFQRSRIYHLLEHERYILNAKLPDKLNI